MLESLCLPCYFCILEILDGIHERFGNLAQRPSRALVKSALSECQVFVLEEEWPSVNNAIVYTTWTARRH